MNRTSSSTSSIVSTSSSLVAPTVAQTLVPTQSTVPTSMEPAWNLQPSMSAQGTVDTVPASTEIRVYQVQWIMSTESRPRESTLAIEMLPSVVIMEKGVCAICLEEWCKGDLATELPCKHKYHLECVEKWLRIHATCPQCRYVMPFKDVETSVDDDEDSSSDSDSSDPD